MYPQPTRHHRTRSTRSLLNRLAGLAGLTILIIAITSGAASAKPKSGGGNTTADVYELMNACQEQGGKVHGGGEEGLFKRVVDCVLPDGTVISCGQLSDGLWHCATFTPEFCDELWPLVEDFRPCNYLLPGPDPLTTADQPPVVATADDGPRPGFGGPRVTTATRAADLVTVHVASTPGARR